MNSDFASFSSYTSPPNHYVDPEEDINTLIAAHLNLIGERLKEISRNIENVRTHRYNLFDLYLNIFIIDIFLIPSRIRSKMGS